MFKAGEADVVNELRTPGGVVLLVAGKFANRGPKTLRQFDHEPC